MTLLIFVRIYDQQEMLACRVERRRTFGHELKELLECLFDRQSAASHLIALFFHQGMKRFFLGLTRHRRDSGFGPQVTLAGLIVRLLHRLSPQPFCSELLLSRLLPKCPSMLNPYQPATSRDSVGQLIQRTFQVSCPISLLYANLFYENVLDEVSKMGAGFDS